MRPIFIICGSQPRKFAADKTIDLISPSLLINQNSPSKGTCFQKVEAIASLPFALIPRASVRHAHRNLSLPSPDRELHAPESDDCKSVSLPLKLLSRSHRLRCAAFASVGMQLPYQTPRWPFVFPYGCTHCTVTGTCMTSGFCVLVLCTGTI